MPSAEDWPGRLLLCEVARINGALLRLCSLPLLVVKYRTGGPVEEKHQLAEAHIENRSNLTRGKPRSVAVAAGTVDEGWILRARLVRRRLDRRVGSANAVGEGREVSGDG